MTRITTTSGFASTAAEVAEGIDLTGIRVIVTGGSSWIGVETAQALAATGNADRSGELSVGLVAA